LSDGGAPGAGATTFVRHLPNVISVLRILLVLPMAWALWLHDYLLGVVLMVIAGASDGLDGWLARRFAWQTRFGAAVDPLADKLLVGVLFVILTAQQHLPVWLLVIVLGRDVLILIGALVLRARIGPVTLPPTFISKCNTAAQLLLLLALLGGLAALPYVSALALAVADPWLIGVVAALGIWTGLDYAVAWLRRMTERAPDAQ
jgi:cardiolipin synthase (CMP-forming)